MCSSKAITFMKLVYDSHFFSVTCYHWKSLINTKLFLHDSICFVFYSHCFHFVTMKINLRPKVTLHCVCINLFGVFLRSSSSSYPFQSPFSSIEGGAF